MNKTKRVNARLSESAAAKLAEIVRATNSTMSEVIATAIEAYYDQNIEEGSDISILLKNGFVGCGKGPRDLSTRYKNYLSQGLSTKHGFHRSR